MDINFILNGKSVTSKADPTRRLLDVLREEFRLTAAKEGCGEGECGACAVLIDGRLVNSCLLPMILVEGKSVVTLEGYKTTQRFQALKAGFQEAGSVQCGFCTPGFVLAAEALLSEYPSPTQEQAAIAVEGNLCRCTGYAMIIEGILNASKIGEGLW